MLQCLEICHSFGYLKYRKMSADFSTSHHKMQRVIDVCRLKRYDQQNVLSLPQLLLHVRKRKRRENALRNHHIVQHIRIHLTQLSYIEQLRMPPFIEKIVQHKSLADIIALRIQKALGDSVQWKNHLFSLLNLLHCSNNANCVCQNSLLCIIPYKMLFYNVPEVSSVINADSSTFQILHSYFDSCVSHMLSTTNCIHLILCQLLRINTVVQHRPIRIALCFPLQDFQLGLLSR